MRGGASASERARALSCLPLGGGTGGNVGRECCEARHAARGGAHTGEGPGWAGWGAGGGGGRAHGRQRPGDSRARARARVGPAGDARSPPPPTFPLASHLPARKQPTPPHARGRPASGGATATSARARPERRAGEREASGRARRGRRRGWVWRASAGLGLEDDDVPRSHHITPPPRPGPSCGPRTPRPPSSGA